MPPQVGRYRPAAGRDALVTAPDRRPAGPRPPPGARRLRSSPPAAATGSIRTGSGPVMSRFVLGVSSRSCAAPRLSAAINGPSALRSGPIRPPLGPRRPSRRLLGPRSACRRLVTGTRRAGSGTPGTRPRHPRSVPARPLRAWTLCRAPGWTWCAGAIQEPKSKSEKIAASAAAPRDPFRRKRSGPPLARARHRRGFLAAVHMALLDGPWRVCIRQASANVVSREAVVQVLDGPVSAIERQQPLCIRLLAALPATAYSRLRTLAPVSGLAVDAPSGAFVGSGT